MRKLVPIIWWTGIPGSLSPEGLTVRAHGATPRTRTHRFFDAVSKYARSQGLPRLHIASNSGARIGLAEELKPYFKVRAGLTRDRDSQLNMLESTSQSAG